MTTAVCFLFFVKSPIISPLCSSKIAWDNYAPLQIVYESLFHEVQRVSERERAIRQFVIVKNKFMSVFDASILLLTMNFVTTLSK